MIHDKLLIVNLKHYQNAVGKNALSFIKSCPEKTPEGWRLIFAVGAYDSDLVLEFGNREFMSQHVDGNGYGAFTGSVSIDLLKEKGFTGSLLNHSEHRVEMEQIKYTVERAKESGFSIVVCAENVDEIRKIADFAPKYIAYEPKELIGGDISVSTARPEVILEVAEICKEAGVDLIVGAGVKNRKDVEKSFELGAVGVLVASGIVLANDPRGVVNGLMGQ